MRKLVHEELAFGPIATGGVRLLNKDVVRSLRMSQDRIEAVAEREEASRSAGSGPTGVTIRLRIRADAP